MYYADIEPSPTMTFACRRGFSHRIYPVSISACIVVAACGIWLITSWRSGFTSCPIVFIRDIQKSATVFCIARTIELSHSVHVLDLNSSGVCSSALSRLSRIERNFKIVLFSDHSPICDSSSRFLRTRLL